MPEGARGPILNPADAHLAPTLRQKPQGAASSNYVLVLHPLRKSKGEPKNEQVKNIDSFDRTL